jgi:iron complex outermembrane recepter protein
MYRNPAFRPHPGFRPRLAAWAATLLLAGSVFAQEAPKAINIAAQPLDKAIAALARQTGAQIVYSTAVVEAKTAPAVRGTLTVREALQQLLAGSGLVLRAQDDQTFTVVRAEQQGALPTVTVAAGAEQPTATGPVRGYAARLSASATKMDTPLLETPQSITVVGAEQIADQKAQSVTEALAYAPGVMADPGYSNSYDVLYSRGFRLQDGPRASRSPMAWSASNCSRARPRCCMAPRRRVGF